MKTNEIQGSSLRKNILHLKIKYRRLHKTFNVNTIYNIHFDFNLIAIGLHVCSSKSLTNEKKVLVFLINVSLMKMFNN
jgi:hypothetical protein